MIKYYSFPFENISFIYNQVNSKNDTELKLLILLIQIHQKTNEKNELSFTNMLLDQINTVNSLYNVSIKWKFMFIIELFIKNNFKIKVLILNWGKI
jgi:hypothetical protein